MTTFAAQRERHAELEARTRAAWTAYSDELRELTTGPAYAEAEAAAWESLQDTLRELDALRAEPPAADA